MTAPRAPFRTVLRGYDPAQVDRRIAELTTAVQEAARQRDDLRARLAAWEADRERQIAMGGLASYEHLGKRVTKILTLAQEEAAELRRRAEEAAPQPDPQPQHGPEILRAAEAQAAAMLAEARRRADEERDRRLAEVDVRLAEAARLVDNARAEADRLIAIAGADARRTLEEAAAEAASLVGDARTAAARVRAEAERELAAATQRRDSINAQLTNVRQMLATLTGGSAGGLAGGPPVPGQAVPGHDRPVLEAAE